MSPRSSAAWLVAACLLAGRAGAEAPRYEIEDALVVRETAQGTRHSVDVRVVRYFLAHVAKHAGSYPPRFENPRQRPEVEREARGLIAIFDVLLEPQPTDPGLLLDAGFAYAMGHNLDLPGSAKKAIETFDALLREHPDHALGNYRYGAFLAGTARLQEKSVPYLKAAAELGIADALYTLGVVHVSQGRAQRGLAYLEEYLDRNPDSERTRGMIQALRDGHVEYRRE
ncbi:MAG: tetratricopeptide repeat protein [Myxococcota bacterium]